MWKRIAKGGALVSILWTILAGIRKIVEETGNVQTVWQIVNDWPTIWKYLAVFVASPWLPLVLSLIFAGLWFWLRKEANKKTSDAETKAKGGELFLNVLNFDYDNSHQQLVSNLQFYNDDTVERIVLSVTFLYRPAASAQVYSLFLSGPNCEGLLGHIDSMHISPKANQVRRYVSHKTVDQSKFKDGAQAGLLIAFTIPGREEDFAYVMPLMQMRQGGGWAGPSRPFPSRSISLDSIGQSKMIEAQARTVIKQVQKQLRKRKRSKWLRWFKRP
jgi:hypothetical protein